MDASAQVNVATRDAALAPGGIDPMAFFEGDYELQPLSTKTPMAPLSICISAHNGARLLLITSAATPCSKLFQDVSWQSSSLPAP